MIKSRQTKSGIRYDVRLRAPDGRERCLTFRSSKVASRYEREQLSALDRGTWIDPRLATIKFEDFSKQWMEERHNLRPTTVGLYESLLRLHVCPTFGSLPLAKITPSTVRTWHAELHGSKPITASKAYRLMREVLGTAVNDGFLAKNPCAVKGAGKEDSPERPTASVAEVAALADALPDHLRIGVTLAAWCQLRRGELLGLERRDVDLLHGTIKVERSANHVKGGLVLGDPKSEAGFRTLTVPPHVLPELTNHLDAYVAADPRSPLMIGVKGGRLRPHSLQQAWGKARNSVGRPDLHFHDLRHSGATWLAISGATTKELMARVGQSSPQAALRYQHAVQERDVALATALSKLAIAEPEEPSVHAPRDIRGMDAEAG